jgi:hypothetical protein
MDQFINNGDILEREEWKALFEKTKFQNISAEILDVDLKEETSSRMKQIGWKRILSAWGKTIRFYFTNPDYRRFLKTAGGTASGGLIQYMDHIGYGLYSGEK